MKGAVVVALLSGLLGGVQADLCAAGKSEIDGNWFCQAVDGIQYSNVGSAGTYNQVIEMTPAGVCVSQPKHFSGPLSPLDEEVSLHFRGPLQLKQLAVYTPSKSKTKRTTPNRLPRSSRRSIQRHDEFHKRQIPDERQDSEEKRQEVTATIDGQIVSWENNWFGTPSGEAAKESPVEVTATIDGQIVSWVNNWFGEPSPAPTAPAVAPPEASAPPATNAGSQTSASVASPPPPPTIASQRAPTSTPPPAATVPSAASGQVDSKPVMVADMPAMPSSPGKESSADYKRIGYYNSASQTLDNLVFLGNHGGQGSGVFDYQFGASLSYCNSHGTAGAASPQVLADTTIPSDAEVIVMLGQKCQNGDCGFVRPNSVAYHGVGGADKVFLFEYSMPIDGVAGFQGDMPAIWMLNAQIPRTVQYGNGDCSCWESGCGEFDIVEALSDGSTYLKSTLHTNHPAGDSDYIKRPASSTMKLAVVFSSATSTIHIQVLPDTTEFSAGLSAADVSNMCSAKAQNTVSDFTVS